VKTREIKIGKLKIGGDNPLFLIAGPCVIESKDSLLNQAGKIKEIADSAGLPFIFKSSYDKANRTSLKSYRGPGAKEGLKLLKRVKKEFGIPVLSDIHTKEEVKLAQDVLDVIQIPALLCRQTDLIVEAAKSKRTINIKKGQFLSPFDVKFIIDKITSCGNHNILITERGTIFGYNNLVSDLRSIPIMKKFGYPVVYDASHSTQMPGGLGERSAGKREFIPYLARAATACGSDGIFIEVHARPDKALCDGPNMLKLKELKKLLIELKQINQIVRD
jgi:2-dehydro-3-deoxyphosphooctonate aldolase (KDO 8-P synthase)